MQWIPRYCGLPGNEGVDKLDKHGTEESQPDRPLSHDSVSCVLKMTFKAEMATNQCLGTSKNKYKSLITQPFLSDLTRKAVITCFQIAIGHEYSQNHLHKVEMKPGKTCKLRHNGE